MLCLQGSPLYQWDQNRQLKIDSIDTSTEFTVHCCHENDLTALVVEPIIDGDNILVNIPNILLQRSGLIRVYIVINEDTVYDTSFYVIARPKPDDYVYTETEILSYETLKRDLNKRIDEELGDVSEETKKLIDEQVRQFKETSPVRWGDFTFGLLNLFEVAFPENPDERLIAITEDKSMFIKFVTALKLRVPFEVSETSTFRAPVIFGTDATTDFRNIATFKKGISLTSGMTVNGKTISSTALTAFVNALASGKYPTDDTEIKNYVDEKIGDVDSDFDEDIAIISKRVYNLEQGIPDEQFLTDSGVAYVKGVPENALPYAEISKVGGMTYKPGGLLIERDTLVSAKVTEIESVGANLFDFSKVFDNKQLEVDTGELESNTNTASSDFIAILPNTTFAGNYINRCAFYDINKKYISDIGHKSATIERTFTMPSNAYYVRFSYQKDTTDGSNVVLNKGSKSLPYSPYIKEVFLIATDIQTLDGYGDGVNESAYNYIDFEKRQFVKCVGKVDLGTLDWTKASLERFMAEIPTIKPAVSNNSLPNAIITADYTPATGNSFPAYEKSYYVEMISRIAIRDTSIADVADFKSAMSGVMLYYELAEPIITDISDLISADNYIEVEGGGTITAVNENGFAVPSEITYMLKE